MSEYNNNRKNRPEQGSDRDERERARPVGVPDMNSLQSEMATMTAFDIIISHVPTGKYILFPGAIQSFDDSFTANFQGTSVYGRMDDIISYQSTKRTINFSFDLVAGSDLEAEENLLKISELQSFLYPSYEGGPNSSVTTIQAPPLLRIFFSNLIQSSVSNKGLLGYLSTVQSAPDFEAGFVTDVFGNIYPKKYTINLSFTVTHEHELGWFRDKEGWKWRGDNNQFPYDQQLTVGRVEDGTQADEQKPKAVRDATRGTVLGAVPTKGD